MSPYGLTLTSTRWRPDGQTVTSGDRGHRSPFAVGRKRYVDEMSPYGLTLTSTRWRPDGQTVNSVIEVTVHRSPLDGRDTLTKVSSYGLTLKFGQFSPLYGQTLRIETIPIFYGDVEVRPHTLPYVRVCTASPTVILLLCLHYIQ